jgi:hypothetical protein
VPSLCSAGPCGHLVRRGAQNRHGARRQAHVLELIARQTGYLYSPIVNSMVAGQEQVKCMKREEIFVRSCVAFGSAQLTRRALELVLVTIPPIVVVGVILHELNDLGSKYPGSGACNAL